MNYNIVYKNNFNQKVGPVWMSVIVNFKDNHSWGCRDDPVVNSVFYSCRTWVWLLAHMKGGSQLLATLVPGGSEASDFCRYLYLHIHSCN